jgi:hypothetical protein
MTVSADLRGLIRLAASPQDAEVSVDDNFVGNAPVDLKLTPGKHTIKVMAAGYRSWSRELSVLAGSEVHLNATLEKPTLENNNEKTMMNDDAQVEPELCQTLEPSPAAQPPGTFF